MMSGRGPSGNWVCAGKSGSGGGPNGPSNPKPNKRPNPGSVPETNQQNKKKTAENDSEIMDSDFNKELDSDFWDWEEFDSRMASRDPYYGQFGWGWDKQEFGSDKQEFDSYEQEQTKKRNKERRE